MADTENAGIVTNAQAARPINIERFIGVSLCAAVTAPHDNATALQEFRQSGSPRATTGRCLAR